LYSSYLIDVQFVKALPTTTRKKFMKVYLRPLLGNLFGTVMLIASITGCGGGAGGTGNGSGQALLPEGSYYVTYAVSGTTKSAGLTYANSQGGTVQEIVSVPWSKQYILKTNDFMYISAQNQQDSGSVITEIRVNGIAVKTTTSTGKYVIATSSGSCC
jgi:hypothetical protein